MSRRTCFTWFSSAAAGLGVLVSSPIATKAQSQNPDMTIIADQIRGQGFACSTAVSIENIAAESAADQPVYKLMCDNATYKVHVIPDQAAIVTEIK